MTAACSRTALVVGLALVGCGAGARGGDVVEIPIHLAATEDAGATAATARALPSGADGPRDAVGMIGEAGRIVTGSPETVLLVNTGAIREHAWAEPLKRAVLGTFVGWNSFMPVDLVHPTADVDWMLLAGSLWLGATRENVFLAHHRLPDARADAVFVTLVARLGGRELDTAVPGTRSFFAAVDHAERAFLRPKSGVLAIVPPASAADIVRHLRTVDVPARVRPGELLRAAYRERPRGMFDGLPAEVGAMRVWVTGAGRSATAHVEGDCDSDEGARLAAETISASIAAALRDNRLLRILTNGILRRATIWADGRVLRAKVDLDEDDVLLLGQFFCTTRGVACEEH